MKKKSRTTDETTNPEKWIRFEAIPGYVGENEEVALAVNRAKVPGGWLIYVCGHSETAVVGRGHGGLTFYPDPEHKWDGLSLPLWDVSRVTTD